MKQTNAPWSWLGEESIVGPENEIVMEMRRDAYDNRSLYVTPENRPLLIAAPDLLDACREALAFCEGVLARYSLQDLYTKLEAAIAKAEATHD